MIIEVQNSIMEALQCYICYDEASAQKPFSVDPCDCKGTIKIHEECLTRIMDQSDRCQTCHKKYKMPVKYYGGLQHITERINTTGDLIKYTINHKGEEHGLYRVYYNGVLRHCTTYNNGVIEGYTQHWYENTNLEYCYQTINGKNEGIYCHDNILTHKNNYINGKQNGLYRSYMHGNLHSIDYIVNDKVEGLSQGFINEYCEYIV